MENELENALSRLEQLKKLHYYQLLNYYDDEDFLDLFWKLINYVETFDRDIGILYRRQEELLNQGF